MKAGIPDEYILKQPLKTIKMKLTLLTIALAFLAQATFGQVLITDGTLFCALFLFIARFIHEPQTEEYFTNFT